MAFVHPDHLEEVLEVADRREIRSIGGGQGRSPADRSGSLTAGELIAEVPAASLTDDAPRYRAAPGRAGLDGGPLGQHRQVRGPARDRHIAAADAGRAGARLQVMGLRAIRPHALPQHRRRARS